ncbi:MAG: hypothetical protein A2189_01165 [Paenibacillus sp. RIFOXYA1_FULL_44_5]|nr:MAG: hypothetical protein A2189_01165 [Paenibacillus sp. RIFOXYA1_FULL_44_5]
MKSPACKRSIILHRDSVELDIETRGYLTEELDQHKKSPRTIESNIAEVLQHELESLLRKTQRSEVDLLGIGEKFRRNNYPNKEKYESAFFII